MHLSGRIPACTTIPSVFWSACCVAMTGTSFYGSRSINYSVLGKVYRYVLVASKDKEKLLIRIPPILLLIFFCLFLSWSVWTFFAIYGLWCVVCDLTDLWPSLRNWSCKMSSMILDRITEHWTTKHSQKIICALCMCLTGWPIPHRMFSATCRRLIFIARRGLPV